MGHGLRGQMPLRMVPTGALGSHASDSLASMSTALCQVLSNKCLMCHSLGASIQVPL